MNTAPVHHPDSFEEREPDDDRVDVDVYVVRHGCEAVVNHARIVAAPAWVRAHHGHRGVYHSDEVGPGLAELVASGLVVTARRRDVVVGHLHFALSRGRLPLDELERLWMESACLA